MFIYRTVTGDLNLISLLVKRQSENPSPWDPMRLGHSDPLFYLNDRSYISLKKNITDLRCTMFLDCTVHSICMIFLTI